MGYLTRLDPSWDLDAPLSPSRRADSTAYAAFVAANAPPLIALSLYVSSANWAATTRPAYSTVLPFPLTWTEPLASRSRMCAAAEHLGLSDLNIDDDLDESRSAAASSSDKDSRGFLRIPERLRPRRAGVRAALSPEQTNLIRLEAAASECLGVLEGLLEEHQQLEGHDEAQRRGSDQLRSSCLLGGDRPTSLDCLAIGHLALMLAPEVPRPWLRDLLRRRYDGLCALVDGARDQLFGGDVYASLPWRTEAQVAKAGSASSPWRATRFARGLLAAAVPENWLAGTEEISSNKKSRLSHQATVALTALCHSLTGAGLVGAVLAYRHLSPFGAALYRWEGQRGRLGAAGALFGII